MEKFKSRRIIMGLIAVLVAVVYGDVKGINPELIIQYIGIIFGIVIGMIGLEDGIKAFKLDNDLQKLIEKLLSPSDTNDNKYPDR